MREVASVYAEERQQAIARQVVDEGRLSVVDLAERFDVTTETIRRDLTALEGVGLVRRVHGGVVPAAALSPLELALGERDAANAEAKARIARAALAQLPAAGGSLLVDAGTTTARFVDALPANRQLSLYTHSVSIAARVATHPGVELHLLPGRVRSRTLAAVGGVTVAAVGALRVDVAVLGTNGLSLGHGLSTPDSEEAATKRAFVLAADRVVALADSSKFDVDTAVRFAELEEVDVLVTERVDPITRRQLRSRGVEVVTP